MLKEHLEKQLEEYKKIVYELVEKYNTMNKDIKIVVQVQIEEDENEYESEIDVLIFKNKGCVDLFPIEVTLIQKEKIIWSTTMEKFMKEIKLLEGKLSKWVYCNN